MEGGSGVSKIQSTLLSNRVKIMKLCDYFVVSAPMIARRVLPLEKHREIKLSAGSITTDGRLANNARMDALLDFIDTSPTPEVFDAFLEGVKNGDTSKGFAKVLKKEADGGGRIPSTLKLPKVKIPKQKTPKLKVKPSSSTASPAVNSLQNGPPASTSTGAAGSVQPDTGFGFGVQWIPALSGNDPRPLVVTPATTPATPGAKKPKVPRPRKTPLPNGPGANSEANATSGTPKARAPKNPKKAASKAESGTKTGTATGDAPPAKKPKKAAVPKTQGPGAAAAAAIAGAGLARPSPRAKPESKIITPGPSLTATLVYKDDAAAGPSGSKKAFNTKVPAGSPFRAKNGLAKSNQKINKMTFQEAIDKQKSAVRAIGFSFTNHNAIVKSVNFNNKSDLFYEGCPHKEGSVLCTKKVQLKGKGKKYVCKDKHENETYELFPRLEVTFADSTTQLVTTLYRENVEILAAKSVSELHRSDDAALSAAFAKSYGETIPIRVNCEKIHKKDLKKSGGATWTNVATILTSGNENSAGPSAKKPRKSSAD